MMTIEDGVRRLRLLDAKGKVWTQEMVLQVEEKSVALIDPQTQVRHVCERSEDDAQKPPMFVIVPSEPPGELPHRERPALPGPDGRLRL